MASLKIKWIKPAEIARAHCLAEIEIEQAKAIYYWCNFQLKAI